MGFEYKVGACFSFWRRHDWFKEEATRLWSFDGGDFWRLGQRTTIESKAPSKRSIITRRQLIDAKISGMFYYFE